MVGGRAFVEASSAHLYRQGIRVPTVGVADMRAAEIRAVAEIRAAEIPRVRFSLPGMTVTKMHACKEPF